jgi:hypothetical protein
MSAVCMCESVHLILIAILDDSVQNTNWNSRDDSAQNTSVQNTVLFVMASAHTNNTALSGARVGS